MSSRLTVYAAVIVIVGVCVLYFRERQKSSVLEGELSSLRAVTNSIGNQVDELKIEIDPSELERLRADQRDAIRLRGEVGALKQQVASADANAARAAADAARARATSDAMRDIPGEKEFSTQATANLEPGQSLILGGSDSAPGKKIYTFVTARIPPTDPSGRSVDLQGTVIEMDSNVAKQFGAMLADEEGNLILDAASFDELYRELKQIPGVNVLSRPRTIGFSGQKATMSVTRPSLTGGPPIGTELEIFPTVSEDKTQIQVVVDAKTRLPNPAQ